MAAPSLEHVDELEHALGVGALQRPRGIGEERRGRPVRANGGAERDLRDVEPRALEKYHIGPTVTERRICGVPVSKPSLSSIWSYRAVRPTWRLIFRNAVTAAPRHEGLPPLCCSRPMLASAPTITRPRSMVRSLENRDR